MTIAGPTIIGSAFQRNQTANSPLSFTASQAVPAGSMLIILWGTDAPDTATCQVSDAAANDWVQMVQSADPNAAGFMCNVFFAFKAKAISAGQQISMQCSVRASYGGVCYMFTGCQGSLYSSTVKWSSEWSATPLAPNGIVTARQGQSIFAGLAVAGPSGDVFTNDASFEADQSVGAGTFNATMHGSARHGIPADGQYTYAPTLNAARQGIMALLAFS
jgi:hypothetical protein